MSDNEKIKDLKAYEVVKHQWIEEVNSDAWLLKHKKTGAKIALLSNDDDNKVFHVGFRTPVDNDKGTPHIIEHTVLCGSEKFPVKDPFMELLKGSLNTFLNAMTYPDKTVYPVASYNDADFKNLMDIYMDAVFHSNIYNEEKIFKQEGWHYELSDKDDDLIYNGIVYNEMKGVYSSVDGYLDRAALQSLFPDNGYSKESGGYPDAIPTLTYEEYLDFHRKYYHPANSYIYLYGDMDMVERLEWMDREYLSSYDYLDVDSHIEKQLPFDKLKEVQMDYPVAKDEDSADKSMLSLNYVVGDGPDAKLNIAFQVLDYALMDMPGAPLKQALIDHGIGKDVYGTYETDVYQSVYSIVAKYCDESQKDEFKKVIDDTLNKIVSEGLDKKSLEAGLASLEFKTKEADFGPYPKGLMFGLQMMGSWLYDDNEPFMLLETNSVFEELKKDINTDYFENLIREYFIDNTHKSLVLLAPKPGMAEENEKKMVEELAAKKASMSDEEIENLIAETKELKAYQEEPSTEEEQKCIPLLEISDIDPDPKPFIGKEYTKAGIPMFYNKLHTNGIGYIDIVFDCSDIPGKYYEYMGLLKYILGYMDTDDRKYTDLNTDINLNLGDLTFDTSVMVDQKDGSTIFLMGIHTKMLYEKTNKAYELIKEIVLHTNFDDDKRLREILEELKSRMKAYVLQSGDSAASVRALSYYSQPYYLRDKTSGISFYEFLRDILDNWQENKDGVISMLKETMEHVFCQGRMMLNYAGDEKEFEKGKELTAKLKDEMYPDAEDGVSKADAEGDEPSVKEALDVDAEKFVPMQKNEGFKTSGQVQYVTRVGNYNKSGEKKRYTGSMAVLSKILARDYLWNNIRVLGGAYGCRSTFNRSGDIAFSSYRDPNLAKTNEVYLNAPEYIRNFTADERQMRKFIIGTISTIDTPLSPSDRSDREFTNYITHMDYETLKTERTEILECTQDDIRELALLVEDAMSQNNICVIGAAGNIEESKDLFKEVKDLA